MRPGEADCRDFLRTGRCKYGESCKYNHPHNVENGGGVKPINPSEPLFPIRPMEPACQYFLKHGTCKFGQSCKFNHPSGAPLSDGNGNLPAGQLVFVTNPGGDASSHLMAASNSVQVLPQRPTEPNCIYFLRNGKCKYGATCKFHHPLDAMSRNNQVQQQQHLQTANIRPSQARDRSHSFGSASSDPRPQMQMQQQMQHNLTYAHSASNISYLQQQRLQPITERVRPQTQQPTHILLPDGQIAVILDPQSLQNVSELNVQDRPKFYLSQANGSTGGFLPSMDQNPVVSPMLTATSNSTSNNTFDSSIDLMGTNVIYQGQTHNTQLRGPRKSGSGGSLSAYGSIDSGSHLQGDYGQVQQVSGQAHSQPLLQPSNLGQDSFPQHSAWPLNEGIDQSNQAQVRKTSSVDTVERQRHSLSNLQRTDENAAAYYWPSSGSFPSIPANDQDLQGGSNYASMPNASSYHGSSNAVGQPQPMNRSYSSERNVPISRPSSTEHMHVKHEYGQQPQGSSGELEGLTMMTSALLTMMDREIPLAQGDAKTHRSPSRSSNSSRSPNIYQNNDGFYTQSEPNLNERASPVRPPPGMRQPPGLPSADFMHYSNYDKATAINRSPSVGGFFVGGDEQAPPKSPPWGDYHWH